MRELHKRPKPTPSNVVFSEDLAPYLVGGTFIPVIGDGYITPSSEHRGSLLLPNPREGYEWEVMYDPRTCCRYLVQVPNDKVGC
jgi:hypothetical protein